MTPSTKALLIVMCIIGPIIAYIYMRIIDKNVENILKTKIIDKGIYKNNPVVGDNVVPIARSFKRVGSYIFYFTLGMTLFFIFIMYKYW